MPNLTILITRGLKDALPMATDSVLPYAAGMMKAVCSHPLAQDATLSLPNANGQSITFSPADVKTMMGEGATVAGKMVKEFLAPLGEAVVQNVAAAVGNALPLVTKPPVSPSSLSESGVLSKILENMIAAMMAGKNKNNDNTTLNLALTGLLNRGPHQPAGQETAAVATGVDPNDPKAAAALAHAPKGKPLFAPPKPTEKTVKNPMAPVADTPSVTAMGAKGNSSKGG
ncbi:MAG: hypothetical protein V4490_07365 [Pseudomonadota bacterium]